MKKLLNSLKSWFAPGSAQKNTLKNLDPERLRRERIKAEQVENHINKEIEELESQKDEMFQKGVKCSSDRQKTQYARKIRQLESQIKSHERHLSLINRNIRVISGVTQIKENEQLLARLGMDNIVNEMDLAELHQWVEEATVEGRFQMEKFEEVLGALVGAEEVYAIEDTNDEETLALVEAMNEAADFCHQTQANQVGLSLEETNGQPESHDVTQTS